VSTVAKVRKGTDGCEEHGIEKGFSVYIHVSIVKRLRCMKQQGSEFRQVNVNRVQRF
jgi:hypothetical protein